MDKKYIMMVND